MKKKIFLLLCLLFCVLGLSSCRSFLSELKEAEEKTLTVSNLTFDSITYKLTADVAAKDRTKIILRCNQRECSAVVRDNKISVVFDSPFYSDIKGGASYDVAFSAQNYVGTTYTLAYWPQIKYLITSQEENTIYNGGAKGFEPPAFLLLNYDFSSVTTNMSFKIFENYGTQEKSEVNIDTSSWKLEDMKNFLTNVENDGKTVEVHYSIAPNCTNGADLKESGFVVYHCKKDVLVKSVIVSNDWGKYTAHLYSVEDAAMAENSEEREADTAGGVVRYQWQVSSDTVNFTDIDGANAKSFALTKDTASSLLGKRIRVKITQTFEGEEQESLVSNDYYVAHSPVQTSLYYDGIIFAGEKFDTSKVKGTITDECGNKYTEKDFNFIKINELDENGYYIAQSSGNFQIQCINDNFYDSTTYVFALVQFPILQSEVPQLSEENTEITAEKVKFASINKDLEISFDGGANYSGIPEDEFEASEGDVLYLRKKAVGTANASGYIKESEAVAITVNVQNIGRKTSGAGLIDGLENLKFSLTKKTSGTNTVITPTFSYTDDLWSYDYQWLIDGTDALAWDGVSVDSTTGSLVINNENFAGDTYQVYCKVRIYVELLEDVVIDVTTRSAQVSLLVD